MQTLMKQSSAVFVVGRLTQAEPSRAVPTAKPRGPTAERYASVPGPDIESTPGEPERGKAALIAPFAAPLRTAPLLT